MEIVIMANGVVRVSRKAIGKAIEILMVGHGTITMVD